MITPRLFLLAEMALKILLTDLLSASLIVTQAIFVPFGPKKP